MHTVGLKRVLQIITVLIVLSIVIGYSYLEMRGMLLGPRITMNTPINGITVSESSLTIDGVAENVRIISLNGREILIDKLGNFKESYMLYPGHNVIMLRAQDRFDKKIEKKLEIIYIPIDT